MFKEFDNLKQILDSNYHFNPGEKKKKKLYKNPVTKLSTALQ